jgi:hypothetical protein
VVIALGLGTIDIILVSRNIIVDCLGVLAAMHDPTMVASDSRRMEWVVMEMMMVWDIIQVSIDIISFDSGVTDLPTTTMSMLHRLVGSHGCCVVVLQLQQSWHRRWWPDPVPVGMMKHL